MAGICSDAARSKLMVTWSEPDEPDRMQLATSDWSSPSDAASANRVDSEHRRRASLANIVAKLPRNTTSTLGSDTVGDKVGEVVGDKVGALHAPQLHTDAPNS
jgi:hypothetical protein